MQHKLRFECCLDILKKFYVFRLVETESFRRRFPRRNHLPIVKFVAAFDMIERERAFRYDVIFGTLIDEGTKRELL